MNQPIRTSRRTMQPSISLQVLVNNLVRHSQPVAHHHNTSIENNVERGLVLADEMHKAIPVMRELLTTVVSNSRNGDIHISAERYRNQLILEIQERNNYNGYALSFSIGSIEPDAASMGGHISITGSREKVITISFSFPYHLMTG